MILLVKGEPLGGNGLKSVKSTMINFAIILAAPIKLGVDPAFLYNAHQVKYIASSRVSQFIISYPNVCISLSSFTYLH